MSTTPDSEPQAPQPASPAPQPAFEAEQTAPAAPEQQVDPVESQSAYVAPPTAPMGSSAPQPTVPGATQPTVPLPPAAPGSYPPAFGAPAATTAPPAAAGHAAHSATYAVPAQAPEPQRARNGGLIAGIAIGAIIGGLVGGGAAAVIASNTGQTQVVQSNANGSLTLNNTDAITPISGVAAVAMPSVVTLQVTGSNGSGSGSGVIYTEDGYIITNAHVATLSGTTANPEIRVRLSDGTLIDGTLVGSDPFADIAVVKIEADGLTPVAIADSDTLNVGELAVAIGAPLNLTNTVTSGVVSALNRGISIASSMVPEEAQVDEQQEDPDSGSPFPWDFRYETPEDSQQQPQTTATSSSVAVPVLQTDASINPGNSGGALLNANAELIGINVALASNGSTSDTAGSDGLGFAIPSNLAVRVADDIIAGEQPSHGLLGVSVVASSLDTDEDANREGGLIAEVVSGGAADEAGLRVGDVITAVNGIPVDSSTSVSAMIRLNEGGSDIVITYSRGGVLGEAEVTLGTLTW